MTVLGCGRVLNGIWARTTTKNAPDTCTQQYPNISSSQPLTNDTACCMQSVETAARVLQTSLPSRHCQFTLFDLHRGFVANRNLPILFISCSRRGWEWDSRQDWAVQQERHLWFQPILCRVQKICQGGHQLPVGGLVNGQAQELSILQEQKVSQ